MGIFNKKLIVTCPIEGRVSPLECCPNRIFSKGMAGEGVVIFPTDNVVYAPMDATVEFVFETKHAIALKGKGLECMIHVGIDSYMLDGLGFEVLVEPGQKVKQGDIMMKFDLNILRYNHCMDATPLIFTNLDRSDITVNKYGKVDANEPFISIERR